MKLYVCLDDLSDEIDDINSIPYIRDAIEKHLDEGGQVVLEYRYINSPSEDKYSFDTQQEFSDFLKRN